MVTSELIAGESHQMSFDSVLITHVAHHLLITTNTHKYISTWWVPNLSPIGTHYVLMYFCISVVMSNMGDEH